MTLLAGNLDLDRARFVNLFGTSGVTPDLAAGSYDQSAAGVRLDATLSYESLTLMAGASPLGFNGQALLVDLPALRSVGGNLELLRDGGVDVRLGLLAQVIGDVRVGTTAITRLGLPALTSVGRHLVVSDVTCNDGVIAFPMLTTVGGDLQVVRATWLSSLLAPVLAHVGSVSDGFPIGDVRVQSNPDLTSLTLAALESVEGAVSVRDNAVLSGDDVAATFASVTAGGTVTLCGNLDDEACP